MPDQNVTILFNVRKVFAFVQKFALDFSFLQFLGGCLVYVREKTGHFLGTSLSVAASEANGEAHFKSNLFLLVKGSFCC